MARCLNELIKYPHSPEVVYPPSNAMMDQKISRYAEKHKRGALKSHVRCHVAPVIFVMEPLACQLSAFLHC